MTSILLYALMFAVLLSLTFLIKFGPVILSAAKNLRVAGEILRCAQNDRFLAGLVP